MAKVRLRASRLRSKTADCSFELAAIFSLERYNGQYTEDRSELHKKRIPIELDIRKVVGTDLIA